MFEIKWLEVLLKEKILCRNTVTRIPSTGKTIFVGAVHKLFQGPNGEAGFWKMLTIGDKEGRGARQMLTISDKEGKGGKVNAGIYWQGGICQ